MLTQSRMPRRPLPLDGDSHARRIEREQRVVVFERAAESYHEQSKAGRVSLAWARGFRKFARLALHARTPIDEWVETRK